MGEFALVLIINLREDRGFVHSGLQRVFKQMEGSLALLRTELARRVHVDRLVQVSASVAPATEGRPSMLQASALQSQNWGTLGSNCTERKRPP